MTTKTTPSVLRMPRLGETMEEGQIASWLVKPGEKFERGQAIVELETDKTVVELPALGAGVLTEILALEGKSVRVGEPIAHVDVGGGPDWTLEGEVREISEVNQDSTNALGVNLKDVNLLGANLDNSETADSKTVVNLEMPRLGETKVSKQSTTRQRATPAARKLANKRGITLADVVGTGRRGRVEKVDVLNFNSSPARVELEKGLANGVVEATPTSAPQVIQQPLPDFTKWGEVERSAMNGIRKATVRSMTNAWSSVPMVTQFDKADITQFEAMRKKFQPRAEAIGAKITPTAMLLKIVAAALRRFPDFNSSLDTANNEIIRKKYVNIGVAVDTENGLLVPVIKNADQKNIIELAKELGDLAAKARARKLTPDDMSGGNFSISNLGGIGGTGFTPIVNPPDVGILGVSRGGFEPVWNKETTTFEPKMMMPLCVSYDHRLIDGAGAARFLRWVCEAIEEPFLMMLE